MDDALDFAEKLVARLCHDLAGPIGAVAAGAELLGEESGDDGAALALLEKSAVLLGARLQLYRFAFGQAGNRTAFADQRRAIDTAFTQDGRCRLHWTLGGAAPDPALGRVVLNLVLLAADCLPRGGDIDIDGDAASGRLAVAARGQGVRLDDTVHEVLRGSVPSASARHSQAQLTGRLVARLGLTLTIGITAETVQFALSFTDCTP